MSRFFVALCVVLLALVGSVFSEVIVQDNFGNVVGLPQTGGNATGGYTISNSAVRTSPYLLYVFITDIVEPGLATPNSEAFYIVNGAFCNGTLTGSTFQPTTNVNNAPQPSGGAVSGNFTGSQTSPNTNPGIYIFTFTIPVGQQLCANITYNSTAPNLVDKIFISITNPVLPIIVGDPQFVGLRGQSYQVHGVDGAVYNIITEKETQVNSRFVFLSQGACPVFNGVADTNCWSHPGSYLGEISFQQIVDGVNHQALVTAGSAKNGFNAITLDGKTLKVGDRITYGSFSINFTSTHSVQISTEHFEFQLSNSDLFINQAVSSKVPLNRLTSHGLLGQTHSSKVFATSTRYIEGSVDDYVIGDDDVFGTDFVYNQFQA
jgi:hypothetical protein